MYKGNLEQHTIKSLIDVLSYEYKIVVEIDLVNESIMYLKKKALIEDEALDVEKGREYNYLHQLHNFIDKYIFADDKTLAMENLEPKKLNRLVKVMKKLKLFS